MLAVIAKVDDGHLARFERHLAHPVEAVWAMLAENDKLAAWFPELRVDDLREGGRISFVMPDETVVPMEIVAYAPLAVLGFTWGADQVRFELDREGDGCHLVMQEMIRELTNHTPKDLAGWHICLDVIEGLLDGRTIESRKEEWERVYPHYIQLVETVSR